jgi:hypothetical protein
MRADRELKMRISKTFLFASVLAFGCAAVPMVPGPPVGDSSLHWWGLYPVKYDSSPTSYTLANVPWPGDYWATAKGGISYRWQEPIDEWDYRKFLFKIPSATDLSAMDDKAIAKLSPAEKYDLWVGRTDLESSNSVTGRQRNFMLAAAKYNKETYNIDQIPGWTGICNGWSLAAINEPQPRNPVMIKIASGKTITFYPGDIKALISQIYFDYQPLINVARLGSMCTKPRPASDDGEHRKDASCRDVHPMSFHVALALKLAKGQSFVFDVEPFDQVWNQPAYGYDMKFTNFRPLMSSYQGAAVGTKNLVDVAVDLRYIREASPEKSALTGEAIKNATKTVRYEYTLELDAEGYVVGGDWKESSRIPDFLWRPDELPNDQTLARIPQYPLSYKMVKELVTKSASP